MPVFSPSVARAHRTVFKTGSKGYFFNDHDPKTKILIRQSMYECNCFYRTLVKGKVSCAFNDLPGSSFQRELFD